MASYINELADLQRGKEEEGEEANDSARGSSESVLSDKDKEKDEGSINSGSGSGSDGDCDIGFVPSWEISREAEEGEDSRAITRAATTTTTTTTTATATGTGTGTALRATTSNDNYYVRKLQSSLGYLEEATANSGLIAHRTERVMLVARLGSIVGGHLNSQKMRKAVSR